MDLLTHIASGAAAATVVAAFAQGHPAKRAWVVAAGALGGAVPDIDAISLWSHFDATFGRLFGLAHSGAAIYGGKFWYSHHAFFHSLAGALIVALLLGVTGYGIYRWRGGKGTIPAWASEHRAVAAGFLAGYAAHLLGDLPTPGSVWGGIAMLWPWPHYIGGSGKVWWWNNYDIFLLVAACAAVNTALLLILKRRPRRIAVLAMVAVTCSLVLLQINTRRHDYAYTGHTPRYAEMELHSKQEQRRILGARLYRGMEWLDNRLPIHF